MSVSTLLVGALLLFPALQGERTADQAAPDAEAATVRQQLPSYPLDTCPITGEKLDEGAKSIIVEGTLVRVCCGKCVKAVKTSPADAIAAVKRGVIAQQLASYPLETCVVSGEPLGEKPHNMVVGTRLIRTCCKDCAKQVEKDSTKALAAVDAALIAAQIKTYPAKNCPVSGEALGSMGDPIDRLYGTKLIRLCCKGCVKSYEKDAAKFAAAVYGTAKEMKPASDSKEKPASRKSK